ncbi:phosphatidylinositide phosphatase SAC2 [Fusarium subglutinans]|uniref:Phosphatidylinositide phosphatase SAC2 n=1 Tax=Gibberella subglutinans TaxID=42677 RepID=A0A8H5NWD4_GIBSU|nr:phosphatidylinositide phosphatase SAC2 [Fusarium subglutinans]KAF5580764.1 phosphatidylinositide phosphatase SAC2 [Fusarium subglutinans]
MPSIARKLLICAAIDGLIIQPLSSKGQRPFQPVRLKYGDASISHVPREHVPDDSRPDSSFEAFGVIGMTMDGPALTTFSKLNYLVTITRRQQVAQICGHPIYVVTEVALTPCTSKVSAEESIRRTSGHLSRQAQDSENESDSSDEDVELPSRTSDEVEDAVVEDEDARPGSARSRVAEDVIRRRGSYGRFAQRWFSRSGWTLDQKRNMGLSNSSSVPENNAPATESSSEDTEEGLDKVVTKEPELLPKLLRTAHVLFGSSRSFYFSYDVDLTRSLSDGSIPPNSESPLHSQADEIFFWNRNLLKPFLSSGQDSLALPLIQGFVGQRTFIVDSQPPQSDDTGKDSVELSNLSSLKELPASPQVLSSRASIDLRSSERKYLITVISRRSTKRAGLRYLRRGIDQDGYVANMVETEQLLSTPTWDPSSKMYSFLQVRGSIPLFFTQSPYAFKPTPIRQHSEEANQAACRSHFKSLSRNYGHLQIINLVEKHGVESIIGSAYETAVEEINKNASEDQKLSFEWFDFHAACRGMKFENVSMLLDQLRDKIESFGSTIQEDGKQLARQQGVFRTNCMDCLDRTNVCQSSFAKHMLEVQLKEEGFDMSAQSDQVTAWFNTLWADNGDAVSKQYASTAAMKGDYTRTRKRDYRGALNDLGLGLARYYSGMVNDYFSQAAIDFLLGNVTAKIFEEFESDMMTKDPAVSVNKMRELAVELCQKRVIADEKEEFHGGWVLLSPATPDAIKSWPLEEVVLLLTDAALYSCRFDWKSDKVSSFERVELDSITSIKYGTYITSTISLSHTDEIRNAGFVVTYSPGKSDIRRTNTRTFSSRGEMTGKENATEQKDASIPASLANLLTSKSSSSSSSSPSIRRLVFKATNADSSVAIVGDDGPKQTETQQVTTICGDIERLALERQVEHPGEERKRLVETGPIISLEEAKKNTGLLEQLGHSLKKMVWA